MNGRPFEVSFTCMIRPLLCYKTGLLRHDAVYPVAKIAVLICIRLVYFLGLEASQS